MRPGKLPGVWAIVVAVVLLSACSDLYCDPESSIACEDDEECVPAPSNCLRSAPSLNLLQLEVSSPRPVVVKVYRGPDVESGIEIWSGVAPAANWTITETSGAYSATALYVKNGDSTLVIDGDVLGNSTMETCDGTCYGQGSVTLDLKLQD